MLGTRKRWQHHPLFIAPFTLLIVGTMGFVMWSPLYGAKPFDDTLGHALIIGMGLCFLLPFPLIFSGSYPRLMFSMFGTGFLLLAWWCFGEKERFAAHPVTQVTGTVTRYDPGSNRHSSDVTYQYKDLKGGTHTGMDTVNTGAAAVHIGTTRTVEVNYLEADPSVSRIVEGTTIEIILMKLFIASLGLWMFRLAFSWKDLRKEEDARIDRWLKNKN